jgi:hypothetical protein
MFGTSLAQRKDDDVIDAAAVLVTTGGKRRWGGSMPGHKTYKRKRQSADTKFHQDYFIEQPLYNEDHFRRRCCPNNSLVILLSVLTCDELQLHFFVLPLVGFA